MTVHAIIELIKYKLSAKRLHGVHSPFAYTLSEDVLYSDKYDAKTDQLSNKYEKLQQRIINKYKLNGPVKPDVYKDSYGALIIVDDINPGIWLQQVNKLLPTLPAECVIVIPGIHKNKRCTNKWKRITSHPKIPMSVDLYGAGLLFFKNEFKEKQHFILKY